MLVELNLVEQRYQAVLEVLSDGATVTDVARRYGVARQTVHDWLRRYAAQGLRGLVDRSSRPWSCPHQMPPDVEARTVEMRQEHPGWGPRTILVWLGREGMDPLPGRTSVERCLIRHGLVTPQARKRKRSDHKRWERARARELWQMDVVGGVRLVDGSVAKIVTGIDDHSRFCVSAHVVARATARPTCDALGLAMRRWGVPAQVLTDNAKVFTGRFGPGTGEVLFDRVCRENGIDHILTARRSPTTTGKVERFHKTLRREFLDGKVFESLDDAQAQLDAWVDEYNYSRPHQSLGMAVPWDRFRPAIEAPGPQEPEPPSEPAEEAPVVPSATRKVGAHGRISFAAASYKVGVWPAGETVSVVCEGGLVHIHHRGVLVATHARRHQVDKQTAGLRRGQRPPRAPRRSARSSSVTRKVDSSGSVSFAGTTYRVGSEFRRRQVPRRAVGLRFLVSDLGGVEPRASRVGRLRQQRAVDGSGRAPVL